MVNASFVIQEILMKRRPWKKRDARRSRGATLNVSSLHARLPVHACAAENPLSDR